jgi:predicted transcriptional regulator of viral defense system
MLFCSKNNYIYTMNNTLSTFGIVPVNTAVIASLYPNMKGLNQKYRWLEKNEEIIRLKKGLYVVNPKITGKTLSTELIANHIYTPSYVSMSSALRYYGLIPESVYTIQSMTIKHSRTFETPIGRFEYTYLSRNVFPVGLRIIKKDNYAFIMATPEKALCDLIANSPNVNLRYQKDAENYLEADIRMDMDAFEQMNPEIFEEYIKVGKKSESIKTVIKLLKR